MSDIDGRWHIEAQSPMGKQTSILDLTADGATASGQLVGPDGETTDILDGKVDGTNVDFRIELTKPMAMRINFALDIDGDTLTGKVKAGIFPPSRATGWRVGD
ncbi:hypothetical protein [Microbacterium thalassium]|uniref:Uncharacterized protein n=1 Tax=Microbacterium thalassium TaxID=362649 RepID=A0A7X0KTJ3_9MICO|nr:hypothetical protein [Microbacterium thalassium]MBB6390195.1 hypothetical protein [Microbacterium thalassium]GLK25303.1 hypothetical protein GCM10017607_26220 [Microbacterium thalassium]